MRGGPGAQGDSPRSRNTTALARNLPLSDVIVDLIHVQTVNALQHVVDRSTSLQAFDDSLQCEYAAILYNGNSWSSLGFRPR